MGIFMRSIRSSQRTNAKAQQAQAHAQTAQAFAQTASANAASEANRLVAAKLYHEQCIADGLPTARQQLSQLDADIAKLQNTISSANDYIKKIKANVKSGTLDKVHGKQQIKAAKSDIKAFQKRVKESEASRNHVSQFIVGP